mgnify:FL=1
MIDMDLSIWLLKNQLNKNHSIIKEAERNINAAIKNGTYLYMTLSDGSTIRLDKPIEITDIDLVKFKDMGNGYYETEHVNLNK